MSYDVSLDNKAACRHSPEPITINTRMSTPPDIHEALKYHSVSANLKVTSKRS